MGKWTADIVSANKPKLEEIMNPVADADPKAKGKAAAAKGGVNPTEGFEEGDFDVTDVPENNFILGDAIEQIIKINYEERQKTKMPKTPNHLPLKLCMVGYPFAGKKTQAALIKEKFGLDVYDMGALVQEAIDFAESNPNPIVPDISATKSKASPRLGVGLGDALSAGLSNPKTEVVSEDNGSESEDDG